MAKDNKTRRLAGGSRWILALPVLATALWWFWPNTGEAPSPSLPPSGKSVRPALSVKVTAPQKTLWPQTVTATGSVMAWQEAVIGAEIANYRLTEVSVEVGDTVKRGQMLARIASDTVASELAEARAALAELEASAAEARSNATRARELREQGFYSAQLTTQYLTAEHAAAARLAAARARLDAVQLRMDKTRVLAPDDGIISALTASVGSLTQPGQALFRLIRGGRLEWRAEVTSADLASLRPGLPVRVSGPTGAPVLGTVRRVSPSVDPATRNGLVYVDLPPSTSGAGVKAGMFARGEFELGRTEALTLPQSAVVQREGFAYVFRLETDSRVTQVKVLTGRRMGDRVEILNGLPESAQVVVSGGGFLADGDRVQVVQETPR